MAIASLSGTGGGSASLANGIDDIVCSSVNGMWRTRTPIATSTVLPMAAAIGP